MTSSFAGGRSALADESGRGQVLEQPVVEYGWIGDLGHIVLDLDLVQLVALRGDTWASAFPSLETSVWPLTAPTSVP